MTPNTLPPWETSPASVGRKPVQPVELASAWPCVSWPSTNVTVTSLQLTVPSSVSVTVTLYWILSPKEKKPPSSGASTTIFGLELPTVIGVEVDVFLPEESNTDSTAVKRPARVYVCVGLGSVEIGEPSPKSHS